MIDLHTHTLLSDGALLPSELVRRAWVIGYKIISLTDHVDHSNIDFVLPRLINVSRVLSLHWPIKVIPGVEITHVPLEELGRLIVYARKNGAKIVIVHGETASEPVLPGTNGCAIECRADILSHPGFLSAKDAELAKQNDVYLEITTRSGHSGTNLQVKEAAGRAGAYMILNTDAHDPEDLIDETSAESFLRSMGFNGADREAIFANSKKLADKALR